MSEISLRTRGLLGRFVGRLSTTSFTLEGIPTADEVSLTKDVWNSLKESERALICEKIKAEFTKKYGTANPPDPTPYAMRLTHRYLDIMNRESASSG